MAVLFTHLSIIVHEWQITPECNQIKLSQVQFNPFTNTLKCSQQLLSHCHCSQEQKKNKIEGIGKWKRRDGKRIKKKAKHLMIITATISNCLAAIITK